jgi:hypothetical protein
VIRNSLSGIIRAVELNPQNTTAIEMLKKLRGKAIYAAAQQALAADSDGRGLFKLYG